MALRMGVVAAALVAAASPAPSAPGFTRLFDGKTLRGWHGDPSLWSVRDGAISGGSEAPMTVSSFLIRKGNFANFELHFRYRISDKGNSGVQFRSRVTDPAKFMVAGYQANVVPASQRERFAMLYDHLGRLELGLLSEHVEISSANGKPVRDVKNSVNRLSTLLGAYRPYPAWNDYVVIAYGNRIVHAVNGYLALDLRDLDPAAARSGILALQLDYGRPMQVQFKDIEIKRLSAPPRLTARFISAPGPAETTAAIPKRPPS